MNALGEIPRFPVALDSSGDEIQHGDMIAIRPVDPLHKAWWFVLARVESIAWIYGGGTASVMVLITEGGADERDVKLTRVYLTPNEVDIVGPERL